jgi:hypothetical protein
MHAAKLIPFRSFIGHGIPSSNQRVLNLVLGIVLLLLLPYLSYKQKEDKIACSSAANCCFPR